MTEIIGRINEVRKRFDGEGITGQVEFGRNTEAGQFVRVKLDDGRNAWGKYKNAGNVRLLLKAIYNRAGRRIDGGRK